MQISSVSSLSKPKARVRTEIPNNWPKFQRNLNRLAHAAMVAIERREDELLLKVLEDLERVQDE